jgi:elongation factor 1 alpha-like protein
MTGDDKKQMRESSVKVRDALLDEVPGITDVEIEESLWHYYFDVDKSVTYLRSPSISH